MKNLILILLLSIFIVSCQESSVTITGEKTELPNKVVKALDDTTLVKQYAIIETDDKLFLLTTKPNEKKFYVDKVIDKEMVSEAIYGLIFLLVMILFFMFLVILDN